MLKKSKSKPIAIACGDFHIHEFNEFNNHKDQKHFRLENSLQALKDISEVALELHVPILCTGDIFHDPDKISNRVLNRFIFTFKDYIQNRDINFLTISGNHDQCEKSTFDHQPLNYCDTFSKIFNRFICIDTQSYPLEFTQRKEYVYGLPYYSDNAEFLKSLQNMPKLNPKVFNILLIHRDLPMQKSELNEHLDVGDFGKVKKLFRKFDLVLSGHIHIPYKVTKNVYMLGAPNQQSWRDRDVEYGYWLIYKDRKPKFVKLRYPEFKYVKELDPESNDFEKVVEDINIEEQKEQSNLNVDTSRYKLVKKYLKSIGHKNKQKNKAFINLIKQC